jgi:hypothetical protein
VVELALITPRALRLAEKLRIVRLLLDENLRLTNHELQVLRESRAETRALLRPYRRLARLLRSPLVLALLESYRRRRKARSRRGGPATVEGDQLAG